MDYKKISYECALDLESFWWGLKVLKRRCQLLNEFGLKSIGIDGCWYDSKHKTALLIVIDEKKWLLAKIKYGL